MPPLATQFSRLSLGFHGGSSNAVNSSDTGPYLSVGTSNEVVFGDSAAPLQVLGSTQLGATFPATITRISTATASLNVVSLAASEVTSASMTVNGAEAGDTVVVNPASNYSGDYRWVQYSARISADSTVQVDFSNTSGAAIDMDAIVFRATAIAF